MCFHKHTGCVFRQVYCPNSEIQILKHELWGSQRQFKCIHEKNLYNFGPYGFLFRNNKCSKNVLNLKFLNVKPHKATFNVIFLNQNQIRQLLNNSVYTIGLII